MNAQQVLQQCLQTLAVQGIHEVQGNLLRNQLLQLELNTPELALSPEAAPALHVPQQPQSEPQSDSTASTLGDASNEPVSALNSLSPLASQLQTVLHRLHTQCHFEALTTITCTDWLEQGVFKINYILHSYAHGLSMMVGLYIARDELAAPQTALPSMANIWPQSETFERELHEMYGISIVNHPDMRDFMLEDWRFMPPMRRDFDTKQFVDDFYVMRPGREDALDVKEVLKEKAAARKATSVATSVATSAPTSAATSATISAAAISPAISPASEESKDSKEPEDSTGAQSSQSRQNSEHSENSQQGQGAQNE